MNLYIDLGNTTVYIGIYAGDSVVATFRTATDIKKSSDEYSVIIKNFFKDEELSRESIEQILVSSVVPSLNSTIKMALQNVFNCEVKFVASGIKTGLPIRMDNPNEVGSDLICVAVGAIKKYGHSLLLVDLGTASKITVIDNSGAFVGGIIMPGIKISTQALVQSAANLPEISLERPKNIIGKNTIDSMNSGIINGHIEMLKGACTLIEKELGYQCKRILTGGYAKIISDLLDEEFIFDKYLILDGLNIICKKNEVSTREK